MEPAKITRVPEVLMRSVLRRSLRARRPKHIIENLREKRKSGNI